MKFINIESTSQRHVNKMEFNAKITMVKNFTKTERDTQKAQALLTEAIRLLSAGDSKNLSVEQAKKFLAQIGG